MNRQRLGTLSAAAAILIAAIESMSVSGADAIDLSYIPGDAVAALVVDPQRVLSSPELEFFPVEVAIAASVQYLGIDPTTVERAIAVVGMPGAADPEPGIGVILRFAKPYSRELVLARLVARAREESYDGKGIHTGGPLRVSLYMPDERTLVVANSRKQLQNMMSSKGDDSSLLKLLKRADLSKSAVAVVDFAAVRPLVMMGVQKFVSIPPEFQEFLKAPELIQSIELSVNLGATIEARLILGTTDAKSAAELETLLENAKLQTLDYVKQQIATEISADDPTEKAMAQHAQRVIRRLLDEIRVTSDGDRVVVSVRGSSTTVSTAILTALVVPAVEAAREAARWNQTVNNMKQIGLAINGYDDRHHKFPAKAIYDKHGNPLLSWRVTVLPFLEQGDLYKQFHLDEPWDSEHNRKLIDRMPAVYRSPSQTGEPGKTVFLVPDGEGTMFGGKDGLLVERVTDGLSNTIMAVEADEGEAVIWTRPDDLQYDSKDPGRRLGHLKPGVFFALFGDGHVQAIPNTVDPNVLRALFTMHGGEPVSPP